MNPVTARLLSRGFPQGLSRKRTAGSFPGMGQVQQLLNGKAEHYPEAALGKAGAGYAEFANLSGMFHM